MDPDGDYESRHSTRSTANDGIDLDVADVASPSKIFAPDDDTKPPAKTMNGPDAYEGATAPPMEGDPLAATSATSNRSAVEPRGTAYDDQRMMSGKRDITAPDEAPISNSVAVPIGFDSDDMALPEAKALPIVSSTANEGTKMTSATLDEVGVEEDTEAQIEEELTPVPVPSSQEDGETDGSSSDVFETAAEQEDKPTPTMKRCTAKRKCFCCVVAFLAVLGIVLVVLFGTAKGQMLLKGYPSCNGNPVWIGDGSCDGRVNTAECGWDGGDCLEFNEKYPNCKVEWPYRVGDGECAGKYSPLYTADCGWDGGDCFFPHCQVEYLSFIGDGDCDGGQYNTAECGWDGGDCPTPAAISDDNSNNEKDEYSVAALYPDCNARNKHWLNDGACDDFSDKYNSAECSWDGGDCLFIKNTRKACVGSVHSTWPLKNRAWCQHKCLDEGKQCKAYDFDSNTDNCRIFGTYSSKTNKGNSKCFVKKDLPDIANSFPNCHVDNPEWIGDGFCNGGGYNTEACGWDGGDCIIEGYPDCHVVRPQWIGDGSCNDSQYNTKECGWDGGDCLPNCHVDNLDWIGDGFCNGGGYNTAPCAWDGGDCVVDGYPDCHVVRPLKIGDGNCDGSEYNTEECGWDGGDCLIAEWPNCHINDPGSLGNGRCNRGSKADSIECGFDGGDCTDADIAKVKALHLKYPDCHVNNYDVYYMDNGSCAYDLNTAECGYDGGDCLFDNFTGKKCNGSVRSTWSNKSRAWCQKKCLDEGSSCKAFDIDVYWESETGRCRIFSSYSSKSSKNNSRCFKKM